MNDDWIIRIDAVSLVGIFDFRNRASRAFGNWFGKCRALVVRETVIRDYQFRTDGRVRHSVNRLDAMHSCFRELLPRVKPTGITLFI